MHAAHLASIVGTSATCDLGPASSPARAEHVAPGPTFRAVRSRTDGATTAAAPADPSQRPRKAEMLHGVRGLRAMARLEVGDEIQVAAVIAPMTNPAQRDHAQRVVAAAETARDEMRGMIRVARLQTRHGRPAAFARCAGDAGANARRFSGVLRFSGVRRSSGRPRRSGTRRRMRARLMTPARAPRALWSSSQSTSRKPTPQTLTGSKGAP